MDLPQSVNIKPEDKKEESSIKKSKKSLDDTDLLEEIKEEKSESLKQKLLQLNHYNNQHMKLTESKYNIEDQTLQKKYEVKYIDKLNKIRDIICTTEAVPEITEEEYTAYAISKEITENSIKPIEDYWKKCLINAKFFTINEKDKLILNSLVDIKITSSEGYDFTIEYVFKENEYLANNTLRKTYCYEPTKYRFLSANTTEPEWKDESKDPSKKKKVKKVSKGKSRETHTTTQEVESFFNIFQKQKANQEVDETEAKFFKEDMLPNSLEYYLNIIEINGCNSEEDCKDKHCSHKH